MIFQQTGQCLNLSIRQCRAQERASEIECLCAEHCQRTGGFQRPGSQTFQSAVAEEFGPGGPGSATFGREQQSAS